MIFSILRVENRHLEGWGGAAQLWAGKKLFSSNLSKITQKEISDQAHPLPAQTDKSKMSILAKNLEEKIEFLKVLPKLVPESVAEIFGNMMGTPHPRNVRRRGFSKFHVLFAKL